MAKPSDAVTKLIACPTTTAQHLSQWMPPKRGRVAFTNRERQPRHHSLKNRPPRVIQRNRFLQLHSIMNRPPHLMTATLTAKRSRYRVHISQAQHPHQRLNRPRRIRHHQLVHRRREPRIPALQRVSSHPLHPPCVIHHKPHICKTCQPARQRTRPLSVLVTHRHHPFLHPTQPR
jgi:hypothetical protein